MDILQRNQISCTHIHVIIMETHLMIMFQSLGHGIS